MANLDFTKTERIEAWEHLITQLEKHYSGLRELKVTPTLDVNEVRNYINQTDPSRKMKLKDALDHVLHGMTEHAVHTSHPSYYGLFNPRPNFPSILADLITATFNPQMAAWSHHPFANEVEHYLVRLVGEKFGYPKDSTDGVFGAGGAEANLTALLCALAYYFPEISQDGVRALKNKPVLYCSTEAHHSIERAARITGLGASAVRLVKCSDNLRLNPADLKDMVEKDLQAGNLPFMVVATAGTTGSGTIDHLEEIALFCNEHNIWFHVDAAFGGALALSKKYKSLLNGIEKSDSITFDIHKWLSVPMAASMFVTSKKDILAKTFSLKADYMPTEGRENQVVDPYAHSIQWSRRFIGLKLYLSILCLGWDGYEEAINHQVHMGNYLKKKLVENNWEIYIKTPLPVVIFMDESCEKQKDAAQKICDEVLSGGQAWISQYPVKGIQALRACITNYATVEEDINQLLMILNAAREKVIAGIGSNP